MQKNKFAVHADSVAVFLLGALFLIFSIGLVILSGFVYQQSADTAIKNDGLRTVHAYLANKVRRADASGQVQLGNLEKVPALLLYEDLAGISCVTYLYCWNGSLCELFVESGVVLPPESGQPIVPLGALDLGYSEDGLLHIETQFLDGETGQLWLSLRSNLESGYS